MKYYNYDIVFQEVPDEVSLAINITGCPNHCEGCHSPHLWQDIGEPLTEEALISLIAKYESLITCVCLMGGDAEPHNVMALLQYVREHTNLRTAWYSGRDKLPDFVNMMQCNMIETVQCNMVETVQCTVSTGATMLSLQDIFNYIKLGPYIPEKGGLKSKTTNQRIYRIEENEMIDITERMQTL